MKPNSLFVSISISITVLSIALLPDAAFSQLTPTKVPIAVDVDWFSKCVGTRSCPSATTAPCVAGSCSWCTMPTTTKACERGHWSSCAESDFGAGSCGTAIPGFCAPGGCVRLPGVATRPCNQADCTS